MILKEDVISIMKEELNSIIDNSPVKGALGVINNRRAFAKTETYRKLRKNELSNEEIRFLLNSYEYESQEIAEFLVDAISDFTAEKLVAIGGLEMILSQSLYRLISNSNLSNALIDKFRMDNPSRSLNVMLEYLRAAEGFLTDIVEVHNVMTSIIRRRFSPHADRESVFEGSQLAYSERDQPVYSKRDKELLMAIKDNYPLIFLLTSNKQKREEKGTIGLRSYSMDNNLEDISRYISNNYSDEMSEIVFLFIKTIERCPYVEIDFVIDYINTQAKLPKEVQLIVLYKLLCSPSLDPIIDFDKALEYCENLYKETDISKGLHEILALATTGSISNLNNFVVQVSNLNGISKERSNAIYKHYFKSQRERNSLTIATLKLKAMINLKVSDLEIAEQVRKLKPVGANAYYITSEFHCDPEKPYSYPGPHTMKEIMIMELVNMSSYVREHKDFVRHMSYKDLVQEFFFKNYIAFNGGTVITWRMANDPSFIKSLLGELSHYSYRMRNVMEVINIKNIGFKKYMDILEDIQRDSNNNRLPDSNEFGYNKNTFAVFYEKALRFATESEINMYKHKIPASVLLSSRYCTYEVFDYFLERTENNNTNKYITSVVISSVIEGVRKNKKLTQDQQIDILVRMGEKPNMLQFYNIDNSKPKTITFNVANSENLTVKDFQNYYSKIREVK